MAATLQAPAPAPGPDRLVPPLLDGLLGWVERNLGRFAVRGGPDGGRGLPGHKPLAELAILCSLLHRALGPAGAARAAPLAAFARDQLVRSGCDEHLGRNPHLLLPYATLEVGLRGCGQEVPALRRMVQQAVDAGYATAHERLPYRTMDLAHVLGQGGYRHPFPPVEELYRGTLLAGCPSPLWMRTQEVYQATHTLFYLADYGLAPERLAAHADAPRLRAAVETLLGVHLRQRDWDLVAELLVDCRCVGHAPEPLASAAWRALHDAWRAHGLVPGPAFDPSLRAGLDAEGWERHCFDECYHTVLVTILACAVWMRPAPALPAPAAPYSGPPVGAGRVRQALDRAAGWLAARVGDPGLSLDDRVHAALGLACADPRAEALDGLGDAGADALLACDPVAVALLDQALAQGGRRLPAVAQAAAAVLAVCRQVPGPPGARLLLLAAEGLLDLPQEPRAWADLLPSPLAPRQDALLAAARLQALGPGARAALASDPAAATALECAMAEAFMRNDLEAGLAVLLALARAGGRGGPVQDALGFLLAQQHPDGFFGFQPPGAEGDGAREQRRVRATALACWTLGRLPSAP